MCHLQMNTKWPTNIVLKCIKYSYETGLSCIPKYLFQILLQFPFLLSGKKPQNTTGWRRKNNTHQREIWQMFFLLIRETFMRHADCLWTFLEFIRASWVLWMCYTKMTDCLHWLFSSTDLTTFLFLYFLTNLLSAELWLKK